ncbi:MAG TPA: DegT/DnrJ/EryC1/StrS family aminotransferase [Actinomycetota bacterium]|nr:DegT/DnrJ/EryC1/StrS family aminotransferase [Actinomycetota bacterium]
MPAILGGTPAFPEGLAFARPSSPDPELVAEDVRGILRTGVLTNGPLVRTLEREAAGYLGVRHCVAVSSCTAGLMLLLRAAELSGDVVLPSFTFVATAHAVAWNRLRPVFADVDPKTLTLSSAAAERALGVRTSAILATHTFGTPCDVVGLSKLARRSGLRLFFDAAHAFGSRHPSGPVGRFGDAEVFSLSPTKVLVAGEGGLIAIDDDLLAERCRIGRDYANPGDYDARFVGLNARMSEFHAAVALRSLEGLEARVARRSELAAAYREALAGVPGLSFPLVPEGCVSTYKDFTVLVEAETFGMDAPALAEALRAEGVETRRYYTPPVHLQRAYRGQGSVNGGLKVTEAVAARVLTLPMWSEMTEEQVRRVAGAVARIQAAAGRLGRAVPTAREVPG